MRWFNMVRALLVIALVFLVACANEGGVLPVSDGNYYYIEGSVSYDNQLVDGARIAVFNSESMELVDEAMVGSDGYYVLAVQQTGNYTVLAGLEDDYGQYMATSEINIHQIGNVVNLNLSLAEDVDNSDIPDDAMQLPSWCWCQSYWWIFAIRCCENGSYTPSCIPVIASYSC